MKIYLAAQFSDILEIREKAKELRKLGHEVTSSWLRERSSPQSDIEEGENYRKNAQIDIEDITRSDMFVLFTVSPKQLIKRGGRHFEAGYAFGCFTEGRVGPTRLAVIGPKENIFYFLKDWEVYESWEAFKKQLAAEKTTQGN